MADFWTALRTRLLADAPIAAITTSIHWGVVPQGKSPPYIRLNTISDPLDEHLKGYTETQRPRVQADCFSSTYLQARDLATKLIAALASPATVGGVAFNRIKAEGPRDSGENVEGIGYVFMASVDLLVEHNIA